MATTTNKWSPNKHLPNLLKSAAPLLDNTNTPRGAKKEMSLGRTFDNNPWIYNRKSSEDFSGFQLKKDK